MDPQEAMYDIREVIHRYHLYGEQAGGTPVTLYHFLKDHGASLVYLLTMLHGTNQKAFGSLMSRWDYMAELIVYAENGGNNKAEDSGE